MKVPLPELSSFPDHLAEPGAVVEGTTGFPRCLSSWFAISLCSQAEPDPNLCALNYPLATACPPLGLGQWPGLPPGEGIPSLPDPITPFPRKETDRSRQVLEAEVWTPHTPWVSLVWRHLPTLLLYVLFWKLFQFLFKPSTVYTPGRPVGMGGPGGCCLTRPG